MSYGVKSILRIGSLRSPPPIRFRRTSPCSGGRIKHLEASLRKRLCSKHGLLSPVEVLHRTSKWGEVRRLACPLRRFPFVAPPNCGGKVVAPATKGGHFLARQGGCMVFAAKGGIKNGAEGAVPRQRSDTIYLPRARALNPPVRRSRSQAEPWQPRAERPGGWLNPHARKGVSTFGNTGKHRPDPDL